MNVILQKIVLFFLSFVTFFSHESVDQAYEALKDEPYPFDDKIEESILRNFPHWTQPERVRFVAQVARHTDAGASYILMVYAHHYGLLPDVAAYAGCRGDRKVKDLAVSGMDIPDSEYRRVFSFELIPVELRVFSLIYEAGRWLMPVLALAWSVYALLLMIRLDRRFFLWLLLLSLVILPLWIGSTWCGWHYRMELYGRYAADEHGWTDIDRMPPAIRAEYAKHDYHPRFRDIKAQILTCIVMLPVVYLLGPLGWGVTWFVRKRLEKRGENGPEENT